MSSNYSANQYERSYTSQTLQNWCIPKSYKQRPTALEGHTTIIADDRGHLISGVAKKGSAWPDFKGTWDLPARLPPYCVNPTNRSVDGLRRLLGPNQAERLAQHCHTQTNALRHCQPHPTTTTPSVPEPPRCSGAEAPPSGEGRQQPQNTEGVLEVGPGKRPGDSGERTALPGWRERPAAAHDYRRRCC